MYEQNLNLNIQESSFYPRKVSIMMIEAVEYEPTLNAASLRFDSSWDLINFYSTLLCRFTCCNNSQPRVC